MTQPGPSVPSLMNLSHSIVSGGTFNQHNHIHSGERPGYARLLENVATAALHDSVHVVDPPKCYPNTRVAIIQNIIDWTLGKEEELRGKPILWLSGGAGAGKSAIARSVAERRSDERLLLGSFFFGAADSTRNHVGKLVATLSYQISIVLPKFRDAVATFIEDDPLIFNRSIRTQFSTLIVRPLSIILANCPTALTETPRLIIIDGLDECSSIDSQQDLLLILQEVTSTTTLVRFLVCSRPESHLSNTFSLSHMVPIIYRIYLDNDYSAKEDIRVYLEDKFKQIKDGHSFRHMLPNPWPTPETMHTLVDKSSGQFIYATTVVSYVKSPRHRPDHRLDAIFKLRPPFRDLPFMELDALYRHIISKAEDVPTALDILEFPALYGVFGIADIEALLQLEWGSVEVMLADLHSIVGISCPSDSRRCVWTLHKSLPDFLSDPQRAGDLYRDMSKARVSHIARMISILSTPEGQQMYHYYYALHFDIIKPIEHTVTKLFSKPGIIKTDYFSSDVLEAVERFPTITFFATPLVYGQPGRFIDLFAEHYFNYLYSVKDVCESTRLVYLGQVRQYSHYLLAVLDNLFPGNWDAHFIYAYYHLLRDPRYRVPRKLSPPKFNRQSIFSDVGASARPGFENMHSILDPSIQLEEFFPDIIRISCDLTEGIKQEAIFAMSACFCLAWLCDNQRNACQDAQHLYGNAIREKRDHPWRWRRMRATSLFNTRVSTMRRYFQLISKSVPVRRPRKIKIPEQEVGQYLLLLDLIPYILSLSGRYEPLVTMCRKKCLSSLSQFWPKKSRRARQAINNYLQRMDSQEGGE